LPRTKSSKSLADACGRQRGRFLAVDVVDERLRGVDRVGVGERLADALVEQLDQLAEERHRKLARSPPGTVATDRPPRLDQLVAELQRPRAGLG